MSWLTTNRLDCNDDGVVNDGKDVPEFKEPERSDQVGQKETPESVWRNWQGCD
jgi:hypothetical protein